MTTVPCLDYALSSQPARPRDGLPGSWSAADPQARFSPIIVSGREVEHMRIRVHKRKQFLLMNHLFKHDKTSPHRFLLYRKWNISNILTFLFNKISFSLVPGTAFHFRIHVSVTHMHPLQPKEHTVGKTQRKMCEHTSTNEPGLWVCSDPVWSVLGQAEPKDGLLPALGLQVSCQQHTAMHTRNTLAAQGPHAQQTQLTCCSFLHGLPTVFQEIKKTKYGYYSCWSWETSITRLIVLLFSYV